MIDEKQIQEAIAYYSGKLDPNRSDAVALAACYVLQDHLADGNKMVTGYSTAPPPAVERAENYADDLSGDSAVGDYGGSDFLQAIHGKRPVDVWAVMDELMETLAAVNPRVYDGVMRQIRQKRGA